MSSNHGNEKQQPSSTTAGLRANLRSPQRSTPNSLAPPPEQPSRDRKQQLGILRSPSFERVKSSPGLGASASPSSARSFGSTGSYASTTQSETIWTPVARFRDQVGILRTLHSILLGVETLRIDEPPLALHHFNHAVDLAKAFDCWPLLEICEELKGVAESRQTEPDAQVIESCQREAQEYRKRVGADPSAPYRWHALAQAIAFLRDGTLRSLKTGTQHMATSKATTQGAASPGTRTQGVPPRRRVRPPSLNTNQDASHTWQENLGVQLKKGDYDSSPSAAGTIGERSPRSTATGSAAASPSSGVGGKSRLEAAKKSPLSTTPRSITVLPSFRDDERLRPKSAKSLYGPPRPAAPPRRYTVVAGSPTGCGILRSSGLGIPTSPLRSLTTGG